MISVVLCVLLAGVGVWYGLRQRRIEGYGGVKPFMKEMRKYYDSTAAALRAQGELPPELAEMERLTQSAQDVLAVFQKDKRGKDPRINGLATNLMRFASRVEHAWEANDKPGAANQFAELTKACNACHRQMEVIRPPLLEFDAPALGEGQKTGE